MGQKGPKMTAAVMLVQNNQNNQKIWSPHISLKILKVRFFWDTLYIELRGGEDGKSGHVFAISEQGFLGPVCDDSWDFYDAGVVCRYGH